MIKCNLHTAHRGYTLDRVTNSDRDWGTLIWPDSIRVAERAVTFCTHSGLSIMGLFQGPQPGALSHTGLSINAGSHSPSVSSSQSSGFSAVGSGIWGESRVKVKVARDRF